MAPYPTLTEAIAQLRRVVHFQAHLKQQLGVESYYFAPTPTQLLKDLDRFLGIINLHQRAFPLESLPVPAGVDVKHLPIEVLAQVNQLVQQWFPLGDDLDEAEVAEIRLLPFYQDWWEEDWYQLDPVIHIVLGLLNHAQWHTVLETYELDRTAIVDPLPPDQIDDERLRVLCQQQPDSTRYLYSALITVDNVTANPFLDHPEGADTIQLGNLDDLIVLKQEYQAALQLIIERQHLNQWLLEASTPVAMTTKINALVAVWNQATDWQQLSLFEP